MHSRSIITIENNDCKIWHRDQVIMDLMHAIQQDNDVILHLNNEGPCATTLGVYKLLDDICNRYRYDSCRITVQTCNLLEHSDKYRISISPPIKHIADLQQMILDGIVPPKQIGTDIKHFGHFIGHSSRARLLIASWLYKYHQNKTLQTFHTTPKDPHHREFIGLEDIWLNDYTDSYIDNAVEFLKYTPFRYDPVNDGPILDMKMYGIMDAYKNIFVDIVCNTYISGNTFYLDEKLWRPIMTKTPFIVHGPRNFIKNMQRLGFKTFDRWWDEGYSEDPPDYQVKLIIELIDTLASKTVTELESMYKEMQSVLEHNHSLFMQLTANTFKEKF